jgi:hypothetical protein
MDSGGRDCCIVAAVDGGNVSLRRNERSDHHEMPPPIGFPFTV